MKRVAPSGATYQVPSLWIDVNLTPGATVMTQTDFLNALGHGSAPDCTARVVVHTTVDANRQVTAVVDHITATGTWVS